MLRHDKWLNRIAETHADTVRSTANVVGATQDYPAKPVRIIDPFGAGGGPDLLARALAPKLSELWGQPVTVENHPGADATAAPALVAKSLADGYTLLISTSAQAYSAALSKNLPYDPLKDFIPVASLTNQPYVLVAGKPAGIITVRELIAAAKVKPSELKFGSAGPELRDWIAKHGGEPIRMTQPEFICFVQSESESAARLIKAVGIKP